MGNVSVFLDKEMEEAISKLDSRYGKTKADKIYYFLKEKLKEAKE